MKRFLHNHGDIPQYRRKLRRISPNPSFSAQAECFSLIFCGNAPSFRMGHFWNCRKKPRGLFSTRGTCGRPGVNSAEFTPNLPAVALRAPWGTLGRQKGFFRRTCRRKKLKPSFLQAGKCPILSDGAFLMRGKDRRECLISIRNGGSGRR